MTRRWMDGSPIRQHERNSCAAAWTAVAMACLAALVSSEPAGACAVCYGAEDSAMTAGMNNAILMLLGVVVVVQGGFVALFLSLRQRARQARGRSKELQPTDGGTS